MKNLFLIVNAIFLLNNNLVAQKYARASGNWNSDIWSTTASGSIVPGLRPSDTSDVFTNGENVTIAGTGAECKNLFISHDVSTSLTLNSDRFVLITGTLTSYDDVNTTTIAPSVTDLISYGNTRSYLRFDASNKGTFSDYVIFQWDSNNIFQFLLFLFDNSSDVGNVLTDISSITRIRVNKGVVNFQGSVEGNGSTVFIMGSVGTAIFDSEVIGLAQLTNDGSVTVNNKLNILNGLIIGSSGYLNSSYSGIVAGLGDIAPQSNVNISNGSIVEFSSNTAQNIPNYTYGNLILSGSGTKTVSSSGALAIANDLTIGSGVTFNSDNATSINLRGNIANSGTWGPSDLITIDGASTQTISGNSIIFGGGLTINKSLGSLVLATPISVSNGLTHSSGTFELGSQTLVLNSGDWVNNSTTSAGSSTISILGTTTISGSSPFDFNNLTIGGSGSLTYGSSANITGDLANGGSFNVSSLNFNGSSAQNISGSGSLNLTSMTINNLTGSVTNNTTLNLSGPLTLGSTANFNADGGSGNLTLLSTGLSGGGSIAEIPIGATFSGDITVQRFVNGPGAWRYFSVPLTNANVGMWQSIFPVTGDFQNPSSIGSNNVVCDTCSSIYTYNTAGTNWATFGNTGVTTAGTSLDHTVGYSVYTYLSNDFTLSMTGTPVAGNVNIPLTNSGDNWNLIPNPYPSPIDWDNMDRSNTTNTVHMNNDGNGAGSFATYLAGSNTCTGCSFSGDAWRGEIAIGQSFWVSATGISMNMTESDKTSDATFLKTTPVLKDNFIRVELKSTSSNQVDDIIINFDDNATTGLEYSLDAKKRRNINYINLSCFNSDPNLDFVINSIPNISGFNAWSNVNIRINDVPAGNYSLNFKELEKFALNYDIYLVDNYLGTRTKMSNKSNFNSGSTYSFAVDQNQASYGDNRFVVEFNRIARKNDKSFGSNFRVYPNPTNSEINVLLDSEDLSFVEKILLSDFNGHIYLEVGKENINVINDFNISQLKNGIYVLKILGQENEKNFKIYKQ